MEVQASPSLVKKMKIINAKEKTTANKIALFRSYFFGLTNVYGTYDPANGRSWQVKKSVTSDTILAHLQGKSPYGVYLLVRDRTRAIVVDLTMPIPCLQLSF